MEGNEVGEEKSETEEMDGEEGWKEEEGRREEGRKAAEVNSAKNNKSEAASANNCRGREREREKLWMNKINGKKM